MASEDTGKPGLRPKDAVVLGALGLLPRNLMSRAMGRVAATSLPRPLMTAAVKAFAKRYGVDLTEAERPVGEYASLGDFFIRRLKAGARPIDRRPKIAVSPADGRVLNFGRLDGETLLQVKGRPYSVRDLLGSASEAEPYIGGTWVTIYLSPRDYHRVHFPTEGTVTSARYIAGTLWPVNRAAVERIERLFCVNERVVTHVDGPLGRVALVMVGATNVGHITMAYDATLEANKGGTAGARSYTPPIRVARGDEMGTFHLGSTVVMVFADPRVELASLREDQPIRIGECIARRSAEKSGK